VSGAAERYRQLEQGLAGGPRSFGQLLEHTGIALPELAKTVSLLLHAGRIGFDRTACADFNRARQVNELLLELILDGRPYDHLLAPGSGGAVVFSLVEALIASAQEIQLLRTPRRQGKGAAVRRGMKAAVGRLQLFTDADGATPIQELARLEQALAEGADLAIGSRALASRLPDYAIKARLHRTLLGNLFNAIVQRSGLRGIADTQCGFKLFRRTVAQDLFGVSAIDGYGFDLELLYVARQRGYHIAEIPVNWSDQPGSKVHPLRDGVAMLRELALIKRKNPRGP
jgi:dolichyl-phosphate beta-glucosyltransferase